MFDVCNGQVVPSHSGLNRRNFLRVGALGLGGLTLADWFRLKAQGAVGEGQAKAKSVIQFFLEGGGPPQTDTFDPKPAAGDAITGPFKEVIKTNVPGITFNAMVPMLAKQADKFSVLRTVTHNNNGHGGGAFIMMTGTYPSDLVYPDIGAVATWHKRNTYQGAIPPYVCYGDFAPRSPGGGFLGKRYGRYTQGPTLPNKGAPGKAGDPMAERQQARRTLLASLDTLNRDMDRNGEWENLDSCQQKAYSMVLGDAKKAFDLSEEKEEVRERYGVGEPGNPFGGWLLLARRLVEAGVPWITVCSGPWDGSHTDNFGFCRKILPPFDKALAALFEDLAQRGLLDTTMVTLTGEFGRTPKINMAPRSQLGRDHWCHCFTCLVAGGGFKGGQVVGESSATGEWVKERPIYPWDLSASMYMLLGIDPYGKLPLPGGCGQAYVCPIATGTLPSGGILKEVM